MKRCIVSEIIYISFSDTLDPLLTSQFVRSQQFRSFVDPSPELLRLKTEAAAKGENWKINTEEMQWRKV